jgi:hypothetical protein
MDAANGKAMTMMLPSLDENLAFGNETLGCGKVVAIFHHHCHPNVPPVHPGVGKVGAEETEGMAAEVEECHIELNVSAVQHRPLDQIWCLENPSCIVTLRIPVIKCTKPERKT